jgi:tripartite ATP-independent transporter DctP family solute receptor
MSSRPASLWLFVLAAALALYSGCARGNGTRVLKLAHTLDQSHPVHKGMVHMADRLREISRGRMRIDIYSGGQLGSERELIELLQIGSLAMTKVSTSPLEGFVPEMKIFSLPYLFRDEEHLWQTLEGKIGRRLLLGCEPYRLRGLCYYDAGSRSFYTKERPVRAPEDLRGLKIRVQKSPTSVRMVQALGGSATPIAWGELYTALQQGVVDGAENNPPSFFLSRHSEVCRWYCLDEHTAVPDVLLISTRAWRSLDDRERAWLQRAVADSVPVQRRLWREATQNALREVRNSGVEVFRPDKRPFQDAVKPLYDSYRGTALGTLIQRIRESGIRE